MNKRPNSTSKKIFYIRYSIMRIQPVQIKFFNSFGNIPVNNNSAAITYEAKSLPVHSYMPLNFKAAENNSLSVDLQSLQNMHCPMCGTKMFNAQELENAAKDIKNVETINDFFNVIDKYDEYINPEFTIPLEELKNLSKEKEYESLDEFIKTAQRKAYDKACKSIVYRHNEISRWEENNNLSNHDKIIVRDYKKGINELKTQKSHTYLLSNHNNLLKSTLGKLENNDRHNIYTTMKRHLQRRILFEFLFGKYGKKYDNQAQTFLYNLLSHSKSRVSSLFPERDRFENINTNIILNCKHCATTNENLTHKWREKQNFYYDHVNELVTNALEGKIPSNSAYPIYLVEHVKQYTKNKLLPSFHTEMLNLMEITGVECKRSVDFSPSQHRGVHCASCGNITIPNDLKCEISDKITKSQNASELFDIVEEYSDLLKPQYNDIIKRYRYIIRTSPEAKDENIIKNLRTFQNEKIKKVLNYSISDIKKIAELQKLDKNEKDLINEYIKRTNEFSGTLTYNKVFPFEDYRKILSETLFNIKKPYRHEIIDKVLTSIKQEYAVQFVMFPPDVITKRSGNVLKSVIKNFFNSSIITVDHLDPKSKYKPEKEKNSFEEKTYLRNQANKKKNLVVMCRECNELKKDKDFKTWHKTHKEFDKNLPIYLADIKRLSDENKINGFENYSMEVNAWINQLLNKKDSV